MTDDVRITVSGIIQYTETTVPTSTYLTGGPTYMGGPFFESLENATAIPQLIGQAFPPGDYSNFNFTTWLDDNYVVGGYLRGTVVTIPADGWF